MSGTIASVPRPGKDARSAPAAAGSVRTRSAHAPGAFLRERGMGASVLVAAISSAFGVLLLTATGFIAAVMRADPYMGDSGTMAVVISILSTLLLGVAVYVAAVVTANTFSTIVAGRTRRIALLRLIGASARAQRADLARQGLVVGVVGAVLGLVLGTIAAQILVGVVAPALGIDVDYAVVRADLLIPAAAVALTTWVAAWSGSRRVLAVTPLQALGGSEERTAIEVRRHPVRNIVVVVLLVIGVMLLALGLLVGLVSPLGVVVAFFGGLATFTAIILSATLIMPPLLRAVGQLLERLAGGSVARLASQNATRYPERSARMAIGVVIGVTLVTMFAVAIESTKAVFTSQFAGQMPPEFAAALDTFAAIMMGVVAVSAVIAAVGLVNLLTIGIVQRRRELGLLRALGLSVPQVRRTVLLEAVHITTTAVAFGLVLGVMYGWVAAQATFGSVPAALGLPVAIVAPAIPWQPIVGIVLATAVLTLAASVAPTRLATRVAPIEALAE